MCIRDRGELVYVGKYNLSSKEVDNLAKGDFIVGEKSIIGKINKERLDTVPRGKFLTILDELGEVLFTFIHSGREIENGFLKPLIAYYNGIDLIVECPSCKLDATNTIRFATQTEIDILIKNMIKEKYLWDGWNVIRDKPAEDKEDEVADVDKSPAEEETCLLYTSRCV